MRGFKMHLFLSTGISLVICFCSLAPLKFCSQHVAPSRILAAHARVVWVSVTTGYLSAQGMGAPQRDEEDTAPRRASVGDCWS